MDQQKNSLQLHRQQQITANKLHSILLNALEKIKQPDKQLPAIRALSEINREIMPGGIPRMQLIASFPQIGEEIKKGDRDRIAYLLSNEIQTFQERLNLARPMSAAAIIIAADNLVENAQHFRMIDYHCAFEMTMAGKFDVKFYGTLDEMKINEIMVSYFWWSNEKFRKEMDEDLKYDPPPISETRLATAEASSLGVLLSEGKSVRDHFKESEKGNFDAAKKWYDNQPRSTEPDKGEQPATSKPSERANKTAGESFSADRGQKKRE